MVTLHNVSRRMMVLNLAATSLRSHETHGFKKTKRVVGVVDPKDGAVRPKIETLNLPSSLTIAAGERVADLPDAVLECPEVKAHMKPRHGQPTLRAMKSPDLASASTTNDKPADGAK